MTAYGILNGNSHTSQWLRDAQERSQQEQPQGFDLNKFAEHLAYRHAIALVWIRQGFCRKGTVLRDECEKQLTLLAEYADEEAECVTANPVLVADRQQDPKTDPTQTNKQVIFVGTPEQWDAFLAASQERETAMSDLRCELQDEEISSQELDALIVELTARGMFDDLWTTQEDADGCAL